MCVYPAWGRRMSSASLSYSALSGSTGLVPDSLRALDLRTWAVKRRAARSQRLTVRPSMAWC
eukprot:4529295-Lingulodinium_polyedra.AAC.1